LFFRRRSMSYGGQVTHICSYARSSRLELSLHDLGFSRTDFWQTVYHTDELSHCNNHPFFIP
jgi:hypothetical protein